MGMEHGSVIEYTNRQGSRIIAALDKDGKWNVLCMAAPGHIHNFKWDEAELVFDMRGATAVVPLAACAWDEGFTACAHEHMQQREDRTHPITRTNPYENGTSRDKLISALTAVEDQLKWLDAIEEVDPSSGTHRNTSAGGAATVIRRAIAEALND